MDKFANKVGVKVPEILLPQKGTDMTKWAVVACDQYTSQPEYWAETERIVGDAPSTLRLMLPEMYLEKPGEAERIEKINATMKQYLDSGILENIGQGLMYVERRAGANTRHGLIVALDLECYDYTKGSTTLIRATEGTIVERIPPRLRIRKDAPVELPHILVLIDDPERTVIEPIGESVGDADKRYDFELMQNGGHIKGYFVKDEARVGRAIRALEALAVGNSIGRGIPLRNKIMLPHNNPVQSFYISQILIIIFCAYQAAYQGINDGILDTEHII